MPPPTSTRVTFDSFDSEKIARVRVARWQAALTALVPPPAGGHHVFADISAVEQYFQQGEPNSHMVEALQIVHQLGDERGRKCIEQARLAKHDSSLPSPGLEGPAEEALDLFTQKSEMSQGVLTIALVLASRMTQEKFNEFLGMDPTPLTQGEIPLAPLKQRLEEFFKGRGIDGDVVVTATDWNTDVLIRILHGDPPAVIMKKIPGAMQRESYTPAAFDLIRYTPETGILAILSRASLVHDYRKIIGSVIFQNADFFSSGVFLDLDVLRDGNVLARASDIQGVRSAVVTNLEYRTDGGRVTITGANCHRLAIQQGFRQSLTTAQITKATISVACVGGHGGREICKVYLGLGEKGNELRVSDRSRYDLVRQALRHMGILLERHEGSEELHVTLVSQAPLDLWRRNFNRTSVDTAIAQRILVPVSPVDVTAASIGPHGGDLIHAPSLPDGAQAIEVPTNPIDSPQLVHALGDRLYHLDQSRIAHLAAEKCRTDTLPHPVGDHLWDLGSRALSNGVGVRYLLMLAAVGAQHLQSIQSTLGAHRLVVLVPTTARWDASVPHALKVSMLTGAFSDIAHRSLESLQLLGALHPREWATPDQRLIIDPRGSMVYWDHEEMEIAEDLRLLLTLLARAQGKPVREETLAPHTNLTVRRWINNLKRVLPPEIATKIPRKTKDGYVLQYPSKILPESAAA